MRSKVVIIVLSVVLSVAANAVLSFYWRRAPVPVVASDVIRARRFDLVDGEGSVRGTIELVRANSHSQPQIELRDEAGHPAVILMLGEGGKGALVFNDGGFEGRVGVGYFEMGDVLGADDNLGAWGVRVLGPALRSTGFGFLQSGALISPAR